MSLLSLKQTVDQTIYESTCNELINELSENLSKDIPTKESFTSHNGIHKAVQEIHFSKDIKDLYKKYHNPEITLKGKDFECYFKYFPHLIDISKMGHNDMSIKQAIDVLGNLKKEIGDTLYGALMMMSEGKKRNKNSISFNPLHPVIISELKNEYTTINQKEKVWTLIIYTWKDIKKVKEKMPILFSDEDLIPEIASIVTATNQATKYLVENKNFIIDIKDEMFVMEYDQIKKNKKTRTILSDSDDAGRNFIIPGQIINIKGIAYPYYGIVYSKKGLAWNLCPMYSANIYHPYGATLSNGAEGGTGICTHSGNSKTQMGLSSLNHSNTTSALNSYIFLPGALSYGNQAIDASLGMYIEGYEANPSEERVLSFKKFKEENDGATKKQYLSYIKDRMKNKMEDTAENIKPEKEIEFIDPEKYWIKETIYNIGDIREHNNITYIYMINTKRRSIAPPDKSPRWKKWPVFKL